MPYLLDNHQIITFTVLSYSIALNRFLVLLCVYSWLFIPNTLSTYAFFILENFRCWEFVLFWSLLGWQFFDLFSVIQISANIYEGMWMIETNANHYGVIAWLLTIYASKSLWDWIFILNNMDLWSWTCFSRVLLLWHMFKGSDLDNNCCWDYNLQNVHDLITTAVQKGYVLKTTAMLLQTYLAIIIYNSLQLLLNMFRSIDMFLLLRMLRIYL